MWSITILQSNISEIGLNFLYNCIRIAMKCLQSSVSLTVEFPWNTCNLLLVLQSNIGKMHVIFCYHSNWISVKYMLYYVTLTSAIQLIFHNWVSEHATNRARSESACVSGWMGKWACNQSHEESVSDWMGEWVRVQMSEPIRKHKYKLKLSIGIILFVYPLANVHRCCVH